MRISFLNTVACADMVFHIGLRKRDLTRKKSIDLKADGKFLDQTAGIASKFGPVVIFLRVKSGKFGRSAKFGQRSCLFHILIIGIKIN